MLPEDESKSLFSKSNPERFFRRNGESCIHTRVRVAFFFTENSMHSDPLDASTRAYDFGFYTVPTTGINEVKIKS